MARAERRARAGEILASGAQPLADFDAGELAPADEKKARWWNAAVPVVLVVLTTLVGLYHTGRTSLAADGETSISLSRVIGASDPFTVLLWASLIGVAAAVLLAVSQDILSVREALAAMVDGFKSMFMAFVVLTLARETSPSLVVTKHFSHVEIVSSVPPATTNRSARSAPISTPRASFRVRSTRASRRLSCRW